MLIYPYLLLIQVLSVLEYLPCPLRASFECFLHNFVDVGHVYLLLHFSIFRLEESHVFEVVADPGSPCHPMYHSRRLRDDLHLYLDGTSPWAPWPVGGTEVPVLCDPCFGSGGEDFFLLVLIGVSSHGSA